MKAIFGGKISLTASRLADLCVRTLETIFWKTIYLIFSTSLWLVLNISEGLKIIKRLYTAKNQS